MVQVITTSKLSDKGFIINDTGSDMILEPRLNQDPNNQLQLTKTGFLVPKIPPQSFVLQPTANVRMTDNSDTRKLLVISGNIGVLHLDFQLIKGSGNVPLFNVPQECPALMIAIEQIISDGLPIWWMPNTKTIYTDGRVTKNRRIIFHSVGVFH